MHHLHRVTERYRWRRQQSELINASNSLPKMVDKLEHFLAKCALVVAANLCPAPSAHVARVFQTVRGQR